MSIVSSAADVLGGPRLVLPPPSVPAIDRPTAVHGISSSKRPARGQTGSTGLQVWFDCLHRSRATLNGSGELHLPDSQVKEEMVQYFVQFDVHQPVDMSREELFTIWLEEARAAQGAVDAGAVTNLWKVVGQRSVFAVLDVPDHTSLDQALESLPIIQKLGSSVDTRAYAIRPYSEWAEELRVAVEGE